MQGSQEASFASTLSGRSIRASKLNAPAPKYIVELPAGAVRTPEVTRYELSEAVAAHRLSESRHFRGKLFFLVR